MLLHSQRYLLSAFVLALFLMPILETNSSAAEHDKALFLRLRLKTGYDDSPSSLADLAALAAFLRPIAAVLRPKEDLDHFVIRQYGVGKTKLPKTYRLLLDQIVVLNDVKNQNNVQKGPIRVPAVPHIAPTRPNRTNPYNYIPATRSMDLQAVGATTEFDLIALPPRQDASHAGTQTDDLEFQITEAQLKTDAGQKLLNSSNLAVLSDPMQIDFFSDISIPPSSHSVLDDVDRNNLSAALAGQPQRSVWLIILDSGWPSVDAYSDSTKELQRVFALVRDRWKLPPAPIKFEKYTEIASDRHCKQIETSLREMRLLDTKNQIHVVYVPLTLEQRSSSVIKELLTLYYLSDKKAMKLNGGRVPATLVGKAQDYADTVLKGMIPDAATGNYIESSSAILNALYAVFDEVAAASNGVYFINESWLVYSDFVTLATPGVPKGLAVVAAGNEPNLDIVGDDSGKDFARRCMPPKDVVTVLNYVPKSFACTSSKIAATAIDRAMVTAFDGEIEGACATSFATPRVAWLLSAAEVVRPYQVSRAEWSGDIFRRLKATRGNGSILRERLTVKPSRLLEVSMNP